MTLVAYHNDPKLKRSVLKQLRAHAKADELIKGSYWRDGKGCAVGCLLHDPSGGHARYEPEFGVPQMLARLEDAIFEGLPVARSKTWPVAFMGSIAPGVDLSRVGWQFLHWLLTNKTVNPGIDHPLVRDAVKQCADVLVPLTKGKPVAGSAGSAAWSAESAAWSAARSAAWSAARSAESAAWSAESAAWSAARSAGSAAWSAESAAWSAARSAAWSAARSAESAAWSAESAASAAGSAASAESAARSAAYVLMANKLIALCKAAKADGGEG